MTCHIAQLFVFVAICTLPACNKITGPGDFDPGKPIDNNNRPPGPGPTVQAILTGGVFVGNCKAVPESCDSMPEMQATTDPAQMIAGQDKTYLVKVNSGYTVRICALHPGVPGREIPYTIVSAVGGDRANGTIHEGDPAERGSPATPPPGSTRNEWYRVCRAVFNQTGSSLNTNFGSLVAGEGKQDLISPSEQTSLLINLGFRPIP